MNKVIIFITGMSGTGKSTILDRLSQKGYNTIDTDYDQISIQVFNDEENGFEWIWDEDKMNKVVNDHTEGILFISGTVSNQGKFYPYFNEVLYLSAPLNVILERVEKRTTHDYGKSDAERKEIIDNFEQFGAIIEASATRTIDTKRDIDQIVNEIETIAQNLLK